MQTRGGIFKPGFDGLRTRLSGFGGQVLVKRPVYRSVGPQLVVKCQADSRVVSRGM